MSKNRSASFSGVFSMMDDKQVHGNKKFGNIFRSCLNFIVKLFLSFTLFFGIFEVFFSLFLLFFFENRVLLTAKE